MNLPIKEFSPEGRIGSNAQVNKLVQESDD